MTTFKDMAYEAKNKVKAGQPLMYAMNEIKTKYNLDKKEFDIVYEFAYHITFVE